MSIESLSTAQLRQAADIKDEIATLERELETLLGGSGGVPTTPKTGRRMSAAGRARIAAAQRRRWAKVKAALK